MSTYLVAFVVSDFQNYSDDANTPATAVWAPKELITIANYTFVTTPKLVKYMEDFTAIPFNTSMIYKIDQVAIPDFAAGAMENWGLLTYRLVSKNFGYTTAKASKAAVLQLFKFCTTQI